MCLLLSFCSCFWLWFRVVRGSWSSLPVRNGCTQNAMSNRPFKSFEVVRPHVTRAPPKTEQQTKSSHFSSPTTYHTTMTTTTTTPGAPGAPAAAPTPSTPAASTTSVGGGAVPMDTTTTTSTTAAAASATSTSSSTTAAATAAATTATGKDAKVPSTTAEGGGDTVPVDTAATATPSATATTPAPTTSTTTTEKRKVEEEKPKARKQPKAPPTLPSIPSTFIPLRVDVSSNDKKTRVVDTLLFDPSCFPVPLYSPMAQAVEDNVREIAYQILSDAECHGMTRAVAPTTSKSKSSSNAPSFVGRVDVYSTELQTKAEDQLRSQIWKILDGKMEILQKASTKRSLPKTATPAAQSTTQAATPATAVSSSTATTPASTTTTATTPTNNDNNNNGLVPISIRMHTVHRIIIHEDIWWDPVNSPLTVVEFARDLAEELNLPNGDEAVIGITTCMLEQLYGLKMDDAPDVSAKVTQQIFFHNNPSSAVGSASPHNSSVIEASSCSKEGLRGAYQMSENNNRNAMSQFAKQHGVK